MEGGRNHSWERANVVEDGRIDGLSWAPGPCCLLAFWEAAPMTIHRCFGKVKKQFQVPMPPNLGRAVELLRVISACWLRAKHRQQDHIAEGERLNRVHHPQRRLTTQALETARKWKQSSPPSLEAQPGELGLPFTCLETTEATLWMWTLAFNSVKWGCLWVSQRLNIIAPLKGRCCKQ